MYNWYVYAYSNGWGSMKVCSMYYIYACMNVRLCVFVLMGSVKMYVCKYTNQYLLNFVTFRDDFLRSGNVCLSKRSQLTYKLIVDSCSVSRLD
jgi:hypothetical protein